MNKNFGSDGGNYSISSEKLIKTIGYTDGVPFISTASSPLLNDNKEEKICGFSYGYMANRGEIRSKKGLRSQELLYELNNNWVCLSITNYQKRYYSTYIYADHLRTPTDKDIEVFINNAHTKGIKVCLKPMLNSEDNMWRAHIGFPDFNMDDKDIYWNEWFNSYKNFILHYAELAQEFNVEMFCIGCEMLNTEHRTNDWLDLIQNIKKVYKGKIVYNTNHDHEESAIWTNVLDYIGTSAYYPVGGATKTYDEMVVEWNKVKERLNTISNRINKQYIFMEIGCRSIDNSSQQPWDFTENSSWNEEEQYNFYKSCLDVFMNEPNFAGIFWWNWSTFQYETRQEALVDKDFNIHLKKAENLIKNIYKKYK